MNLEQAKAMAAEWRRLREAAPPGPWEVTDSEVSGFGIAAKDRSIGACDLSLAEAIFVSHAANAPVADVLEQLVAEVERLTFEAQYLGGLAQYSAVKETGA